MAYLSAGLCVLPARRDQKRPVVSWKAFQRKLPTAHEVAAWFANEPDALCVLTGEVSGRLELIDFDNRGELFETWRCGVEADSNGLTDRLVIASTQSGGRHAIYRCSTPVCGNLKLAQRKRPVSEAEITRNGKGQEIATIGGKSYPVQAGPDGAKHILITLIETRGEGGLFLTAPTEGYEILQGDLCDPPVLSEDERDVLLRCAWALNECPPPVVDGPHMSADGSNSGPLSADGSNMSAHGSNRGPLSADNSNIGSLSADHSHIVGPSADISNIVGPSADHSHVGAHPPHSADKPGDEFNRRGDVRTVLRDHGWTCIKGGDNEYWRRPGKDRGGHSATLKDGVFYVFTSNATPFEPMRHYSPFAVYAMLEHQGDYPRAARELRQLGYGGAPGEHVDHGVDLSAIVGGVCELSADGGDSRPEVPDIADPGPIPEHLFEVPGLIRRVMDFTLENAPYPNTGLAFCGAVALQSYLCGRKVCTSGDLRPNLYLLALASSGTGKDFPRKVNGNVLFQIGHVSALGDKFASGEGIQDALARSSAMLFQNDEMDGVLRQINLDRENKRESIPNILLTLYTSANDVYPMRVKAGQKEAAHIDQPHLTLFGTATPQFFYESLSQRMLTNGFFARLIIVDIGRRGEGQTPGSPRHLPEDVLQTARWWAEFQPGTIRKNLLEVHPEPRIVPATDEAAEAIIALQRQTEEEYDRAHERNDETARVAWSRTCENAKKLALIRACSVNHEDPAIDLPAVEWATDFAMHQTRRQLYLASSYVAENPFHGECLKVIRKLQEAPNHELSHQVLLKRMKTRAKDFREVIETMEQRGEVLCVPVQTGGRTGLVYRLAAGVK